MLDSGVRLAAASLPVGVPVVVGLVVAVLRRRDLPAVSTPAIAGLAVQLVVVLISTFLVAATSFDAFGLTPETLLPLSSVLGFVVILLQVVSWTLLLLALFRRLPGTAAAETAAPATPQRDDRTPTGRHALLDHRGHQVVAEAGTTFLPVGAAAGAAGAGAGLGAAAATAPDAGTRTGPGPGPGPGPRPMAGPPTGPPRGFPPGPPPGPPFGMPSGPPPGTGPASPESSPLRSVPLPVQSDPAQEEPAPEEPALEEPALEEPVLDDPDEDEPPETETFAAYGATPEQPVEEHDEAPEQVVVDEEAEDGVLDADDTVDPADEHDADPGEGPDDGEDPATTEHPGYLDGVTATSETPEVDAPGEDVDEEPVADAEPELVDEPEDTVPAETPEDTADGNGTGEHDGQAPPTTGNGASGGHPWFDPDGEAARSQPERR